MCEIEPKGAALATVWIKGSKVIDKSNRIKFGENKIIIFRTIEDDAGYYTCSVTTANGIYNGTAFLTVEPEEDEDGHGKYLMRAAAAINSSLLEFTQSRNQIFLA